jgi:uncharacterized repeat protein (TIGR03803 family)
MLACKLRNHASDVSDRSSNPPIQTMRLLQAIVLALVLTFGSLTPALNPQTSGSKFAVLYAFNGNVKAGDGLTPIVPLLIGRSGVLYGATYQGGSQESPCYLGCGTVFSLTPPLHGGLWKEAQLHRFTSGPDGFEPDALALAPDGVLYGMTASGGKGCGGDGCGTAYALSPPSSSGGTWKSQGYAFPRIATLPDSVRVAGTSLYGTSRRGGTQSLCQYGCGSAFSLIPPPPGGSSWKETLLFSFDGSAGGAYPIMTVQGPGGVIYGTSQGGNPDCPSGCGLVFSLSPPSTRGALWTETILHTFTDKANDGAGVSGIVLGSNGVIYGVTGGGGSSGMGTVFSLTPATSRQGSWTEKILYSFAGTPDAAYPNPGLAIEKNGVLYGTTYYGGDSGCPSSSYGCGTVFSLTPPAAAGDPWTEKVLHAFTGGDDGGTPVAGVTIGSNGILYGTTTAYGGTGKYGTVFSLIPRARGCGTDPWNRTVFAGHSTQSYSRF